MSVSRTGPLPKRKKVSPAETRRDAVKDAVPDVQPPGRIKKIRKIAEVVAENDEEDD